MSYPPLRWNLALSLHVWSCKPSHDVHHFSRNRIHDYIHIFFGAGVLAEAATSCGCLLASQTSTAGIQMFVYSCVVHSIHLELAILYLKVEPPAWQKLYVEPLNIRQQERGKKIYSILSTRLLLEKCALVLFFL
jgi:hypothetical protein